MTIEENSYTPDYLRSDLHVCGPFRLIGGRGIIDAKGRLIATAVAGRTMDENGYMRDWRAGRGDISACCADDHAHALAYMLNNPARYFATYCANRAANAANASARDWWRRLAGNARKAETM